MSYAMDAHSIPLLARAAQYGDRLALVAEDGQLSYAQLLERSAQAATRLLQARSAANGAAPHPAGLDGARIAFLAPAGLAYAQTTWAIWQAGGVAVTVTPGGWTVKSAEDKLFGYSPMLFNLSH